MEVKSGTQEVYQGTFPRSCGAIEGSMKWFIHKKKPVTPPKTLPKKAQNMPAKEPDELPAEEKTLPYYCYPHTVTRAQADIDSFDAATARFNGWPVPTVRRALDGDPDLEELLETIANMPDARSDP